jgi:hypothetical protein
LGYVNPYAQYAITPDIAQQLAPYANDYAAFIRDNPNSWLVPYAKNARFQKMLGSGNAYSSELSNYRSPDYASKQETSALERALLQAQIGSTNALANQRNTPKTTTAKDNTPALLNYAADQAQSEINSTNAARKNNGEDPLTPQEEQAIRNKWFNIFNVNVPGASDANINNFLDGSNGGSRGDINGYSDYLK